MKTSIKLILLRLLGIERYLYLFSRFIILKLQWDKNEKDFLYFLRLLPPEGTVLDIGANIGVMSYYLANEFPRRTVYAFEPVQFNYRNLEKIKKVFCLNNLFLYQLALGNTNGVIEMVVPVQKAVRFHGLAHVKNETMINTEEGEVFECPVIRLDDFADLKQEGLRITGVKIDVENYEYHVLKGAEELLKSHRPLIYCELWDNENRRSTMEYLTNAGYRTMVLEKKNLVEYRQGLHTTQNFFFVYPADDRTK